MSLLAIVALIALAVIGRYVLRTWLAPGAFFALYWSVAFIGPIVVFPRDRVPASALLWVVLAVVAVYAGVALAVRAVPSTGTPVPWAPTDAQTARLTWAMCLCSAVGLGAPLVAVWTVGWSVSTLFSPEALFAVARAFSLGRYQQTYEPPALGQALLPFLLAAPLFGGLVAATAARRSRRLLSALPFLPALAMTLTQTQRAVTLAAVVLWVSSYLAGRVAHGARGLFTRRHVVVGGVAGLSFLGLFFVAGWARLGKLQAEVLQDVTPKIVGAAAGHASIFGRWFDTHALGEVKPGWGVYTLAGPFEKLGLGQRKPGLFDDSLILENGDESNLYTLFRALIEDFTLPGAIVVLTLLGVAGGAAYAQAKNGRSVAVAALAAFYACTMYGFVTSIFIYNSVIAAFLLCGLLLWRLDVSVGRA